MILYSILSENELIIKIAYGSTNAFCLFVFIIWIKHAHDRNAIDFERAAIATVTITAQQKCRPV